MRPMLRTLYRNYRQIAVVGSLVFATALSLGVLGLRIVYTRELDYLNLGWNLFLI
jgi:hypothetical protein